MSVSRARANTRTPQPANTSFALVHHQSQNRSDLFVLRRRKCAIPPGERHHRGADGTRISRPLPVRSLQVYLMIGWKSSLRRDLSEKTAFEEAIAPLAPLARDDVGDAITRPAPGEVGPDRCYKRYADLQEGVNILTGEAKCAQIVVARPVRDDALGAPRVTIQ